MPKHRVEGRSSEPEVDPTWGLGLVLSPMSDSSFPSDQSDEILPFAIQDDWIETISSTYTSSWLLSSASTQRPISTSKGGRGKERVSEPFGDLPHV